MNDYKVRKDFNIEIPKSVKMIITILEKTVMRHLQLAVV